VLRNPQHRSLLIVVSVTSSPPFQPLHHQRNVCHTVVNSSTWQTLPTVNRKHFFMNILCIVSFCPQRNAQQNAALRQYTPEARSTFIILKLAFEHAHAHLLPRRSWSWIVLLPSDTHRKPLTYTTAVLLPFVTYLLTLPRIITTFAWKDWGKI
jgi:hypothetical protein